jgi:hypothetical protein
VGICFARFPCPILLLKNDVLDKFIIAKNTGRVKKILLKKRIHEEYMTLGEKVDILKKK